MLDHQICVAYWYGRYKELTEMDYKTLDVINWSFAQINYKEENGKTKWFIETEDEKLEKLKEFSVIKNKGLKLCLSLGGWHDDKSFWDTYAYASSTKETRESVALLLLDTVKKYDLDGIDMDWEYPQAKDRENFSLLMAEIYKVFKKENKDYLVTIAIPAGNWIGELFDIRSLNDCLDYFYIMSYDLDDGSDTSHLSSLKDAKDSVSYFIKSGASKEKLVIGSAFYGRIYNDVLEENDGLAQKSTSKDDLSYSDILKDYLPRVGKDVKKVYDKENQAYFLYDKTNKVFITYEDKESVIEKWEYVKTSKIGGLMFWSYNNDLTNTLISAINSAMNK